MPPRVSAGHGAMPPSRIRFESNWSRVRETGAGWLSLRQQRNRVVALLGRFGTSSATSRELWGMKKQGHPGQEARKVSLPTPISRFELSVVFWSPKISTRLARASHRFAPLQFHATTAVPFCPDTFFFFRLRTTMWMAQGFSDKSIVSTLLPRKEAEGKIDTSEFSNREN